MKNLEIKQLEEKDELNADALISLGFSSKTSTENAKIRNMSIESDWISASESLLE